MKLLFIRHAIAMDRELFEGDDLQRPLTEEGRKKARKAFAGIAALYPAPELIVHSEATRARETAELLSRAFPKSALRERAELNPGADYQNLLSVLNDLAPELELVAVVGHEPDFSEMISGLIQARPGADVRSESNFLHLDIKKASLIEIQMHGPGAGELCNFVAPKLLRKIGKA